MGAEIEMLIEIKNALELMNKSMVFVCLAAGVHVGYVLIRIFKG